MNYTKLQQAIKELEEIQRDRETLDEWEKIKDEVLIYKKYYDKCERG